MNYHEKYRMAHPSTKRGRHVTYTYKSGVYVLYSIKSGKIYIGSTNNLHGRCNAHYWFLRNRCGRSHLLQSEYDKHGASNLKFYVLLYCDRYNLRMYEQMCIDAFECELNQAPNASSLIGMVRSVQCMTNRRKDNG